MTHDQQRFLDKVHKIDGGCWEWTGAKVNNGYGVFHFKERLAHRASWILFKGEITNKSRVLHTCDNRLCVNPDHLFLGTQQKNIQDCISKNRFKGLYKGIDMAGEANPTAKLDREKIKIMFSLLQQGHTQKYISELFGLHPSTFNKIVKGKNWKSISI